MIDMDRPADNPEFITTTTAVDSNQKLYSNGMNGQKIDDRRHLQGVWKNPPHAHSHSVNSEKTVVNDGK